jgi:hypothetical protein
LLVPTEVIAAYAANIFFGFDEVWFFPTDDIEQKPNVGSLVGPSRIDQATLDQFDSWMTANRCSLGLGDGIGLNFIVKAHGLVRNLLGHSMQQPQADVTIGSLGTSPTTGAAG